jgi:hypothetical protein
VFESVGHQIVQALHSLTAIVRIRKVLQLVCVLLPDVVWPEHAAAENVLAIVSDDVLEERRHEGTKTRNGGEERSQNKPRRRKSI